MSTIDLKLSELNKLGEQPIASPNRLKHK
jgi:hypothetical protein